MPAKPGLKLRLITITERHVYVTGHAAGYTFLDIADWERAQQIANGLAVKRLHHRMDEMARRFCPVQPDFGIACHRSVDHPV